MLISRGKPAGISCSALRQSETAPLKKKIKSKPQTSMWIDYPVTRQWRVHMLQFTPPNPSCLQRINAHVHLEFVSYWIMDCFPLPICASLSQPSHNTHNLGNSGQFELPNNMQYINTPDGLCYFKGSLTLYKNKIKKNSLVQNAAVCNLRGMPLISHFPFVNVILISFAPAL